jgi:hypothetical protein
MRATSHPQMIAIPPAPSALDEFCSVVLRDPVLQDLLSQPEDAETFLELVLAEAKQHGLLVDVDEVRRRMQVNRQADLMRRAVP